MEDVDLAVLGDAVLWTNLQTVCEMGEEQQIVCITGDTLCMKYSSGNLYNILLGISHTSKI